MQPMTDRTVPLALLLALPLAACGEPSTYRYLELDTYHACGIDMDQRLACSALSPERDPLMDLPDGRFEQIEIWRTHACGLSEGDARCWPGAAHHVGPFRQVRTSFARDAALRDDGSVAYLQARGGAVSEFYEEFPTPPEGMTFEHLAVGEGMDCGVATDGTAWCWGTESSREIDIDAPVRQVEVGLGPASACALDAEGRVECWGVREDLSDLPTRSGFVHLSVSAEAGCAVHDDGSVACWGQPDFCDITALGREPDGPFTHVTVGECNVCALRDTGSAACWGDGWVPDL